MVVRFLAQPDPSGQGTLPRWRVRPFCGPHDVQHWGARPQIAGQALLLEEMKALYAEALRIGEDLELVKAVPPEDRDKILAEKVDAMQKSAQRAGSHRQLSSRRSGHRIHIPTVGPISRMVKNSKTTGLARPVSEVARQYDRRRASRIEEYQKVSINRRDVVQAYVRSALYVRVVTVSTRCAQIKVERHALN